MARRIAAQGAARSAHPRAHAQRQGRAAQADRRRRRPPHGGVLRLDRGRGRLAHRHRRCGRRAQQVERQCAAQGAGRAAAARAAAAGEPFGGAGAADHALALPHRSRCGRWSQADVAAARCGRDRVAGGRCRSCRAAAAAADGSVARALALLDGDALALRQRGARSARPLARRSIPARCTRSAMRSPAPTRCRSPPSSTPSMPGCRFASTASRARSAGWRGSPTAWERINAAARDAETYNLERKPLVFGVFGLLAEATRG